jgi:hypothetical protein
MKKIFSKCVAAYLIAGLTFGTGAVYAYDDDDQWGDFDASVPFDYVPEPEPEPAPQYVPPASEPAPFYSEPPSSAAPAPQAPPSDPFDVFQQAEPETPSYGAFDIDDDYSPEAAVDQSSVNFIKVVRHPRNELSEHQNAIIEGLQVSVEPGRAQDEVNVACYFIFRDKPSSYFYDINRREKKLVFEFVDTRTGSSPIAAVSQSPLREIIIEETQVDANKDIKGLNPEWHDMIRISFYLDYMPAFSVTDEHNIISFKYKWTTNAEKYKEYIEKDRFPMVFWLSAGTLGAIGIGALTYFLLPKKDKVEGPLSTSDLPERPGQPGAAR